MDRLYSVCHVYNRALLDQDQQTGQKAKIGTSGFRLKLCFSSFIGSPKIPVEGT
jgi:hypothetical protein